MTDQPEIHIIGAHRIVPGRAYSLGVRVEQQPVTMSCWCSRCRKLEPLRGHVDQGVGYHRREFRDMTEEATKLADELDKLRATLRDSQATDTLFCCRAGRAVNPRPCPVHDH